MAMRWEAATSLPMPRRSYARQLRMCTARLMRLFALRLLLQVSGCLPAVCSPITGVTRVDT